MMKLTLKDNQILMVRAALAAMGYNGSNHLDLTGDQRKIFEELYLEVTGQHRAQYALRDERDESDTCLNCGGPWNHSYHCD